MNTGILKMISTFLNPFKSANTMTHLEVGDVAPDFAAPNEKGETVRLADFKGKKLILFFYPADNTPSCTAAACNLRDNYQELRAAGYEMLGVSPDSEKKHDKFIQKYQFPFSLVSDEEQKMMQDYGVWGTKKFMGKVYDGVHRTTFVIDEQGKIAQVFRKVNTKNHTEQILEKSVV